MPNILIVYSSTDGQTQKICHKLQAILEQEHHITVISIDDIAQLDLAYFDKIVIGASIRYGRHSLQIVKFIENNKHLLDSKPNAFFSVNVVARKQEKNRPETNPYVQKFLKRINWKPKQLAVFAGKIDYPRYSALDRTVIRFIMWMTNGPTDPSAVVEFTDWRQVELFGHALSKI